MDTRNKRTLEGRPVGHPQTRKIYTREYKLEWCVSCAMQCSVRELWIQETKEH